MIFPVRHQDVPAGVGGHAFQALELARGRAPAAKAAQVGAVGVKQLNAIVARVRDEDVALLVNGDAPKHIA